MLDPSDEFAASSAGRRQQSRPKRLGPLYGEISLCLHTTHAMQVFCGRHRNGEVAPIPGINSFARAVETSSGRPDREDFMARVAEALADADAALCQAEEEAADFVETLKGLTFAIPRSKEPRVFDLRFRSPQSFQAARLIGRFDHLVATLMALKHLGVISKKSLMRRIDVPMRRLRHPINVACGNGFACDQRLLNEVESQRAEVASIS